MSSGVFGQLEYIDHIVLQLCTLFDAIPSLHPAINTLHLSRCHAVFQNELTNASLHSLSVFSATLSSLSILESDLERVEKNSFVWFPALKELSLSGNKLYYLDEESLTGLKFLEYLDLSSNKFVKIPLLALSKVSPSLRSLDLSNNKLTGSTDSDNFDLGLSSLTRLNFSFNQMTFLGNWINELTSTTQLFLSYNPFESLSNWTHPLLSLTTLGLHNIKAEFPYLKINIPLRQLAPQLQNFISFNTYLNITMLQGCSNLIELDMRQTLMDDYSCHAWSIIDLPNLKTLNLASNLITNLPLDFFATTYQITYLDISYNYLTTISSETLTPLTDLEVLILEGNQLVSTSLRSILVLPSLVILQYRGNQVSYVPSFVIRDKLKVLKELDLSNNQFSCSCDIEEFRDWIIEEDEVFIRSGISGDVVGRYTCISPSDRQGQSIHSVSLDCQINLALILGVVITCFLTLSILTSVAFY